MKILNSNQGGGREVAEYRNRFEHDITCLVNDMWEQFLNLVMSSKGTFQKFRQRRSIPSNIRSQFCVEYNKSRSPQNEEIVAQLASHFHMG